MFAVNRSEKEGQAERESADRLTQLGRALRELGVGWIAAGSPQAKGRVERGFQTDQDRLIKQMRLEKVKTMAEANEFLEKQYWPEWNKKFAKPLEGVTDVHRPMTGNLELPSILSHVESRVIANDYTISFAGRRYQISRGDIAVGMKQQRLRVELHLDGSLKARYQGKPVTIFECGQRSAETDKPSKPAPRKDHNAGGKSRWMDGFWEKPSPLLWIAVNR
jgi:hypothetical protein